MKESEVILRNKRMNSRFSNSSEKLDLESNDLDEGEQKTEGFSLEQDIWKYVNLVTRVKN